MKRFILRHSPIVYTLIWGLTLPFSMYGVHVIVDKDGWSQLWGEDCSYFLFPLGVVGAIYVAELAYYIWEMTTIAKYLKNSLPYGFGSAVSVVFAEIAFVIVLTISFVCISSVGWKIGLAIVAWFFLSLIKYSTGRLNKGFSHLQPLKVIK